MPVKTLFAPHLGRTVRMGRRRPDPSHPRLSFSAYRMSGAPLPTPPASCDFSAAAEPVLENIYGNANLGDCVIAGGYHIVGVETGNAGNLFTATNAQIIADYSAIGGYDPSQTQPDGSNPTDQGCDEVTALNYWQQNGFADGTKLAGWLAVDATNQTEVMQALFIFQNLYFGVELPDSWVNPMPSASGFVWDADAPDPSNGHCVCGVGYNAAGITIDTWGMLGTLTWAAVAALCVESAGGALYVMLTPDELIAAKQASPEGFNWSELEADFAALGAK